MPLDTSFPTNDGSTWVRNAKDKTRVTCVRADFAMLKAEFFRHGCNSPGLRRMSLAEIARFLLKTRIKKEQGHETPHFQFVVRKP
jgi:hypothetical protein